jgi:hypothetical protein
MEIPRIGETVHYVSYGTPGGEFGKECRAAIVTQVLDREPVPEHGVPYVGLCVLNPTGQFFNPKIKYHDGAGEPGDPKCPEAAHHADGPFRYCACGWTEPTYQGGTCHPLH